MYIRMPGMILVIISHSFNSHHSYNLNLLILRSLIGNAVSSVRKFGPKSATLKCKLYMIKWYIEGQITTMRLCVVNLRERVICKNTRNNAKKIKGSSKIKRSYFGNLF